MKIPAMRYLAIPPALCALVGFTLCMLCIFAGSQPNYLESHAMLTLNTSMIGIHAFEPPSSSSSNSSGGLLGALKLGAGSITSDIGNEIESELNKGVHDIAEHLNISDFYSWHLLDFCEGVYKPGPEINATNPTPWKSVTACSNRTGFFTLNATQMLQSSLRPGISLSSLDWPTGMEYAIDTVAAATQAMYVLYCIGAGISGFAMFAGIATVFVNNKFAALLNAMLDILAFVAMGLASTISTTIISKVADAVNEVGPDVGIEAIRGYKFMTLSWVATLMMALGVCGWTFDILIAKRRLAKVVPEKAAKEEA